MSPATVIRSLRVYDEQHPLFGTYRIAKRIAIAIVGGTVLTLGIIMMVTPGPGIPAIIAGLGILAVEFAWARVWLKKAKDKAEQVARRLQTRACRSSAPATGPGGPPPR